jgi:hypothetical protein
VSVVTPTVESSREPEPGQQRDRTWRLGPWLVMLGYLLGALAVTARLWVDPASRVQDGDLRDVDQMTWFIRYGATAISHGHLPALVTTAMNAPHGINLMWNTSLVLPSILLTPVTLLAGPQASLNVALALGFAGSAAAMYFVLRRWDASVIAAALGGALYGFSPALLGAGIGHYHLVLAMLAPLMIDALVRIVTGRGTAWRNGIWLGVLASAQLFTGEEALVDAVIAGLLLVLVLAICRPRAVLRQARGSAIGLGTAAVVALVLSGRALQEQFQAGLAHASGATTTIHFGHKLAHLFALPYSFVTPSSALLFHTAGSAASAAAYPEPQAEYLAYLGWPLIIVLLTATIIFWRQLAVRVAAITFIVLELFSLGSASLSLPGFHYPAVLLPWYWLQGLPLINTALPNRLCILADGAAAVVLAFALDLARQRLRERESRGVSWSRGAVVVAVLALLPLIPLPYRVTQVSKVPDGWQATFASLHLPANAPVLLAPVPYGVITPPMRWQGDTGYPATMIGGDFIAPNIKGFGSRAGRAGQTVTTKYINSLWLGTKAPVPTRAQINTDLATWHPAAVVAVTSPASRLAKFLVSIFGRPTSHIGRVLAWRR